jgi:hypothetical protein
MTKEQAINYMLHNPYHKITHRLFAQDEYLYSKGDGIIYDEAGYVFEDFEIGDPVPRCGMRIRNDDFWWKDWSIYRDER